MSTNSNQAPGGGPDPQSAAVIQKLKRELEESNRKFAETSANLSSLSAQQKKAAGALEAELRRTQELKGQLEQKDRRMAELQRQVEEYKALVQESHSNHGELIRTAKVKNRIENSALVLGGLALPAGLLVAKALNQELAGLATSSAGAATFLTAAAMKAAAVAPRGNGGGQGASGSPKGAK